MDFGSRGPGRPPGTTYELVDTPRYDEMEDLLRRNAVPSLTAAARQVVPRAYGFGTTLEASIERRLVRGFRQVRST
jgi:hypothetical protein